MNERIHWTWRTSIGGTFRYVPASHTQMSCEGTGLVEKSSGAEPQVVAALLSLNFFMADIQAGIGPFLGACLLAFTMLGCLAIGSTAIWLSFASVLKPYARESGRITAPQFQPRRLNSDLGGRRSRRALRSDSFCLLTSERRAAHPHPPASSAAASAHIQNPVRR
jgi:hypothetical protein